MSDPVNRASEAHSGIRILLVDDELLEFKVMQQKMISAPDFVIEADYASTIGEAVEKAKSNVFQLILVDNRLFPNNDFRETVPQLRHIGYTGPIGVVSSDISDPYFQQFPDYGVDFRIGKDEIDFQSIRHIIDEYVDARVPKDWFDGPEEPEK
jgi:DNA-binding NarL/FixJ family response regulator